MSFREEVKPPIPYTILRHVKEPCKYGKDTSGKIQWPFCHQVSPASLLDVPASNCQRALVDESGMITNQVGKHDRSEMVVVQGSPCVPTPQR
jgi:hypothetical protein